MLSSRLSCLLALAGACSYEHGVVPLGDGSTTDSAVAADAAIDAPVSPDASACYGTFVRICLAQMPPASYAVATPTTIDTDTGCTQVHPQASGPALCVITADVIQINAHLRAAGSRPLVLLATQSLSIGAAGLVDVGSWRDVSVDPYVEVIGAGTASPALCGSPTGGGPDNGGNAGAGGGAGGSFGGRGGNGATGRNGSGGTAGVAAAALPAPTFVRGGCRGTSGGSGDGNAVGQGAAGGGAVVLIAGTTITNAGHIRANGMGGYGGAPKSGGGGGGSGGMIVLDASSVSSTGIVNANGGGGGEGGGGMNAGAIASSATLGTSAAVGGTGNINGGDGGAGSYGIPLTGGNAATAENGGGGGGGAAGVIELVPAQSLGGTVSPPAS